MGMIKKAVQMVCLVFATQLVKVSTLLVHGLDQSAMKSQMESSRICPVQDQPLNEKICPLQVLSFPLATINGRTPNITNAMGPPKRRTHGHLGTARPLLARTCKGPLARTCKGLFSKIQEWTMRNWHLTLTPYPLLMRIATTAMILEISSF